jgi:hypothetical protein
MPDISTINSERSINQLLLRYCRAMDRADPEIAREVWHPEGVADYRPSFQGPGRQFLTWMCERHLQEMLAHVHQLTNILIRVEGNCAHSEAYVTATMVRRIDGRIVQTRFFGRYLDEWSRKGGRWAIDYRRYVHEFDEAHQIDPAAFQSRGGEVGRRDRRDPSYRLRLLQDT